MKRKIIYGLISLCLIVFGFCSYFISNGLKDKEAVTNAMVELNLECGSAYLVEENSGKVLYAQNELVKMHPASMTKMMGLMLVCEAIENQTISKDDMVSVSSNAASMGGSQVFLQPFEEMTVDDLLKCVCIASANDAMYALSEVVGTTNENFIKMMNDKAKELKLENTHFVNVTGFDDDEHYTCAKDMAMIALELLKYKDLVLPYTSIYDTHIREDSDNPFWLVNTNKMVKYYQGMDGLKTGYTTKAGFCLTSTAKRNNVRLISVIMKAPSSVKRNEMTKTLLDYGFSKIKGSVLYNADSQVGTISIEKAKDEKIPVYTKQDIIFVYEGALDNSKITKEIILNSNLSLPILENEEVGYLQITYGKDQYQYPLMVKNKVEPLDIKELMGFYMKDILF